MTLDDIFDKTGQDGKDNQAAFEKLPKIIQYFISSQQKAITSRVKQSVIKKFGTDGLADLVKNSGFRSLVVNTRHHGVPDSLHLWGCACDFAKIGRFRTESIPVCSELQVIDSGDCWHVQLSRC